jgi:hypothetical protein
MNTFIGKPCKKCGNNERYCSGNKPCIRCVKENSKRRFENGETKKWVKENKDKVYARNNAYYHSLTPEEKILRNRKQQLSIYGLTLEDYDAMIDKQNGSCAICFQKQSGNLFVDHCHKTNEVRGLLCNKCNSALGFLNDDISLFENAIRYLT